MAIQNEPTRIQIPFADSGTKNVIPDTNSTPSASQAASWTDGFPAQCSLPLSAGGIPPARADFNGILNAMTQSERFTQEGGVWAWDAAVDYGTSRMVLGSDGKIYWSIAQSGPNVGGAQDPTSDASQTYWQSIPTLGILPVSMGGTGSASKNFVDLSSNQNIDGIKTFLDKPAVSLPFPGMDFYLANLERGGDVSEDTTADIGIYDKNKKSIFLFRGDVNTIKSSSVSMRAYKWMSSTSYVEAYLSYNVDSTRNFRVSDDNVVDLGTPGLRWKTVYAGTGAINTSDERLKMSMESVPDTVLDAWGDVKFIQFQFKDAVEEKGAEDARLHSGLVAQSIEQAFRTRGLDVARYGLFCWDRWDAEPERVDENGEVVSKGLPAGDRYSLRYEEALCMEAAYQRRRADRAEARLAALEERLAAIEDKLNV